MYKCLPYVIWKPGARPYFSHVTINIQPHCTAKIMDRRNCSTYFVILQNDVTVRQSQACAATVLTNNPNLCIVCEIWEIVTTYNKMPRHKYFYLQVCAKWCILHAVILSLLHVNVLHHNIYSRKILSVLFHHVLCCHSNTHQIGVQGVSSIVTILEYSQEVNNLLLVMHKWVRVAPTQRQEALR